MRYEYRLRLFEMLRLEKDAEYEDPRARAGFWALLFALGLMPLAQFFKYLDGNYGPRDMLIAALAAIAFCTVRFVYLTVRRLRKVYRRCGNAWSSPVYNLVFRPDQFEVTCPDHVATFDWGGVEVKVTPTFVLFILNGVWRYPLPKRVIPPDELPKLMAFLTERIPPKPPVPAPSPLDPPVA